MSIRSFVWLAIIIYIRAEKIKELFSVSSNSFHKSNSNKVLWFATDEYNAYKHLNWAIQLETMHAVRCIKFHYFLWNVFFYKIFFSFSFSICSYHLDWRYLAMMRIEYQKYLCAKLKKKKSFLHRHTIHEYRSGSFFFCSISLCFLLPLLLSQKKAGVDSTESFFFSMNFSVAVIAVLLESI